MASSVLGAVDAWRMSVWKLVEYLGLAAYILYFPRAMDLAEFGALAVVVATISVFWLASSLGTQSVFGRFFPEYLETGQMQKLRVLYSQMCLARLTFIALLSGVFPWILGFFVPEATDTELLLATAVFSLGAVSTLLYQLQFGLNRLSRWIVRESCGKFLLVTVFVVGGVEPSLERVLWWMLVIEAGFFLLGLYWSWRFFYIGRQLADTDGLMVALKFGLVFFGSNLLLLSIWRVGEMMLAKLSPGNAMEVVAQFSVANSIAYTLYGLFSQVSVLLVPSLTAFYLRGEIQRKQQWLASLLKYTGILVILAMLVIYTVGDALVLLVFGERYPLTADMLLVLLAALIPMMLMRIAMSMAMVKKNLGTIFQITLPAFGAFIVLVPILAAHFGGLGVAAALVLAALAGAGMAMWRFSLWVVLVYAKPVQVLLAGCMALALLHAGALSQWYALLASVTLFVLALLVFKAIDAGELRKLITR